MSEFEKEFNKIFDFEKEFTMDGINNFRDFVDWCVINDESNRYKYEGVK